MSEVWHVLSRFDKALGCYSRVNNAEDGSGYDCVRSLAAKPRLYRPVSSAARLFGQALRIGPEVMAIAEGAAAWPGVAALRLASETGERFSRSRDEHVEAICVRGTGLVGAEA